MFFQTPFFSYKLPDIIPNLNIDLNAPSFPKPKPPKLRKDPVLDAPEELKKWLDQRRRRYPGRNTPNPEQETKAADLSILEQKLRKKICILSGSSRRTQIKVQQIKELCRTMTEGQKIKRKQEVVDDKVSSDSESEEGNVEVDEKVKLSKEISRLEKQIQQSRPKEFYKSQREGHQIQQLSKGETQSIKKQIKELKHQLKALLPPAPIVEVKQEKIVVNIEEHTKDMIQNLEEQKEKMDQLLKESLDYRFNPANFKYKSNTLYANLLIDEIYKERQYLLQAFRYIIKEKYFDKQQEEFEQISSESEDQIELSSSSSNITAEEEEYF